MATVGGKDPDRHRPHSTLQVWQAHPTVPWLPDMTDDRANMVVKGS